MYYDNENINPSQHNEAAMVSRQPLLPSSSYLTDRSQRKHKKLHAGVVAFSLSFALIGGILGGAVTGYFYNQKTSKMPFTSVSSSDNIDSTGQYATALAVTTKNSINQVYETYKTAVVGVQNEGISTNVFGQETQRASTGTGFIISEDGFILTNNHVVANADKLTITLYNEDSYPATVVGFDPESDVALLKVEATGLNAVKLGNSDNLIVGETILAIGNPLGELTYTVTTGIVSAENREINENGIPINMFQTDAAINPGNSGGPVFNLNGEVIGISTAKYASSVIEGIGFAIPINDAISIANQLKETGHVKGRPYLGVSVTDVSNQPNASSLPEGAYVASVDPNGSAMKAGVQLGDIITSINGKDIKSTLQLKSALKNYESGSVVEIIVFRNGKSIDLSVLLGEKKQSV